MNNAPLLQIHQREGTIFITDGQQEHIVLAAIVIAAIPTPPDAPPAVSAFKWSVSGDIPQAATALARFLIQHPPFAAIVDGLREIFTHENRIGGKLQPDQLPPGTLPLPPGHGTNQ